MVDESFDRFATETAFLNALGEDVAAFVAPAELGDEAVPDVAFFVGARRAVGVRPRQHGFIVLAGECAAFDLGVGDAEKALNELTMKENSRIVKYNVEFWKLASKLDWNESALCARYYRGLPLRLRTEVLRGGKPTTLAALRLKAQDTDEIYWMMKEEANHETRAPAKKEHKPSNSNNTHNSKSSNSEASSSANPTKSDASNKPNTKNSKDNKKDYTKVGKNGKLTSEERERRMKEGLCLYCGEKGHVAHDCPKSKAAKGRAATVASSGSTTDSADSKK